MNISNLKKWHFLIIAAVALVLALAIGGFLRFKREERERLELAKTQCLKEVSQMSDEQLAQKVSIAFPEDKKAGRQVKSEVIKYFLCKFDASDKSEKNYEETKRLIELTIQFPEWEESFKKKLDDLKNTLRFSDTLEGMLAIRNLNEICPDKLPKVCIEEIPISWRLTKDEYYQKIFGRCNNICSLVVQYSENKDKFEKEILNFKDWSPDLLVRNIQYKLKIAFAYRIGGEEVALKICDNLTDSIMNKDCIAQADVLLSNIDKEKVRVEQCINQYKELRGLICSALY